MYKDGMLSNDIYSFDSSTSGNVIAGEARSHWSTMDFMPVWWNYNNIYF